MEGKQDQGEQRRPFKWRQNTVGERRRMRNDRKKRKRRQRRKDDVCKWKADANVELSQRLRKESKEKERLLYLAKKYYLKWRQNKEIIKTLQERAAKQPTSSRFGTHPKVRSKLYLMQQLD